MRRVPPSTVIREELDRLLARGVDEERNVVSEVLRLALRSVVQQVLEQEQTDFLGRGHYERATEHRGHRNGYEDATLRTAEGGVEVRTPQVRGSAEPFRPKLLEFLDGNSSALERLVVEMYARGLSVRDVEDAFRDPVTGELLISRSAVSEITDALWEEYEAFCSRDLKGFDVCHLFLDAIYESLRRHGAKEGVLVAWGICPDGRKVLLHMAVGNKESEECWTEFLRNMQARGLRPPISVTSDGAPGLVNAVETCLPRSIRIRCWYHLATSEPSSPTTGRPRSWPGCARCANRRVTSERNGCFGEAERYYRGVRGNSWFDGIKFWEGRNFLSPT